MRLINTHSLKLEEYNNDDAPPYAILSHTWGNEEVSFEEMMKTSRTRTGAEKLRRKAGFYKIEGSARIARGDGYGFIWVDTCRIEKISSAELSEAINSMFRWYQRSEVCYAYLTDIPGDDNTVSPRSHQIRHSRWFTRGWTLQELLAPIHLVFYSATRDPLGARQELTGFLQEVTGIAQDWLMGEDILGVSVAQRMFWASSRFSTSICRCYMARVRRHS